MLRRARRWIITVRVMLFMFFLFAVTVISFENFISTKAHSRKLVTDFQYNFKCTVDIKTLLFGLRWERRHRSVNHVLLVTQMRSGSSFTARLLTMSSTTFYEEEPIRELFGDDLGTPDKVKKAVGLLRDLLHCRFATRPDYYSKRLEEIHYHNLETYRLCKVYKELCYDPRVDEAFCEVARVRFVRLVNVELKDAMTLMRDPDLNVKIIHLVRDPRGLLSSREIMRMFIRVTPNMTDERILCGRYGRDLSAAERIAQKYPDRYVLLRYEDLTLHPDKKLPQLFRFMGTPYRARVADRAAVLTKGVIKGDNDPFGYRRNSSETVFRWRHILPFERISAMQGECWQVLRSYGYRIFETEEDLRNDSIRTLVRPEMKVRELKKFILSDGVA